VTEFRASIVIGKGSLSFEIIRELVERMPILFCPRAFDTPAQPIAVSDVVAYLAAAADRRPGDDRIFEVGGSRPVTYGAIFREYARQRGLRRPVVFVPLLSPGLIRWGLPWLVPEYAHVAPVLADNISTPMVVVDHAAEEAFDVRPCDLEESIARVLAEPTDGPLRVLP